MNSYYDTIPIKSEKDIMDIAGDKGRWQYRVSIHIFFIQSLVALHALSMTFLAPKLDHWCKRTEAAANMTTQEWKRIFLPNYDRHCSVYDISSNDSYSNEYFVSNITPTVNCFAWDYDDAFYASTLTSKWNLVCQRKWLVSFSKSVFMAGMLMSNVLFGYLADRLGRKPAIVSAAAITYIFVTSSAFANSITVFVIIRFFIGFGMGGYYNASYILLMEIVSPHMRPLYGLGIQLGWTLGFLCLPLIAWFVRDSFWLQIALAVPAFLHLLFSWLLPESPPWLISKGRIEEARAILMKAGETNKISIVGLDNMLEKIIADMELENEESKNNKRLLVLMKTPGFRRLTSFLFILWFVNSFIYYGLSYNTNELIGNPYINFALSGIMEIPACFLAIFIVKSVGMRKPLAATMIVGAIICLILYLIPIDIPQTILAAAMIHKFFITVSFGILYVLTADIFPSVVRNIGLGSTTVCESIGSIVAPFTKELAHATHRAIPQMLFGILSLFSGYLVIFLPNTDNLDTSESLEENSQLTSEKEEKQEKP